MRIKNTGKLFSTAAVLGAVTTQYLKIMFGPTLVCLLPPGEVWYTKDDNGTLTCTTIHVRSVGSDGANNSGGHVAVERLVVK